MGMVELSPVDREYCRDVTLQVLDRTLHDYADTASWASGSSSSDSDVEHEGWKKLRSQGNVSMFAEKTTDLRWMTSMRGGGWQHPVAVVAVGRMCCSLQEVLYGLVASDPAEFKLRSVLMDSKVEDDVEVEAITAPSEGEPFEFMGVTRYVDNHGCFHRPHEYVLVVATGEVFTSCGEHLGYQICQSVSLSQWPVTNTVTRKRVIQARVLRELPDGSVGVYYKIIVDSRSFVPKSVVQASLWRVVQDFWKMAPRCADAKKLCYCVEHRDVLNLSGRRSPCGSTDPFTCGMRLPSTQRSKEESRSHRMFSWCNMEWYFSGVSVRTVFDTPVLKVALLLDATTRAN
ncbi:hypothetical protein PI124_g7291 [Phytophthora idaei]|nr:hypothetical protein PI125_g7739 [Phytophthora idaei]KAG3161008.1 hypothetical protein PI126_g6639 [Phytophthora idaei]KAG3248044.1 hypothetical protein PI124_g7291 [Phytophthora idaei]